MSTGVRQIASITNATARRLVDAAIEAAEAAGQRSAIAVVDATGQLSAFARMDGAALQAVQISQDKAYSAASFGMPTGQWPEVMKDDTPLTAGISAIDRLVPFGGGLPIVIDGDVVGGIGVAGGHWSDDAKVAETALAALDATA
ncbi:GlcG/HbpS family heme-binding protein [Actinacidiphila yeochonensis]|uniref:GlcG/HbpS family heme-binding protein n=1 Tax=Actinacidiphila yeochonensis TaxID=89050 RepID=UPI00055F8FBA|nr:heme-binding protein [Actinacidiphila yeochonensis]